jgi:hypothetical protein
MTRTTYISAAIALAVTLPAMPAQAAAARTFVSAAGSDSNNCTNVATPCRQRNSWRLLLTAPQHIGGALHGDVMLAGGHAERAGGGGGDIAAFIASMQAR